MYPDLRKMAEYCSASKKDLVRACDWHTHDSSSGYLAMRRTPGARILAVAHIDFLRSGKIHYVSRKRIVSSALDDRAGVYIVMDLLPKLGILADVLLTDNEETSGSTIRNLGVGMLDAYNWIVQFDRRNEGAVYYGYHEMLPILGKYFPSVERGTFTCISAIEACSPVGAFNVGVAYSQEHTEQCALDGVALNRQMMRFRDFYRDMVDTKIMHTGANPGEETHACRYKTVYSSGNLLIPGQTRKERKAHRNSIVVVGPTSPKRYDVDEYDKASVDDDAWWLHGAGEEATLFPDEYCQFCGDVVHKSDSGYKMSWQNESLCDMCQELLLSDMEQTKQHMHLHLEDIAYISTAQAWFWDKAGNVYRAYDMEKSEWLVRAGPQEDTEWNDGGLAD